MKLIGYPHDTIQDLLAYLDRQPHGEVARLVAKLNTQGMQVDVTTNEELALAQAMQATEVKTE